MVITVVKIVETLEMVILIIVREEEMACCVGTMKIARVNSEKNCYTKNYTDNSSCLNILYFCICISFWEYSQGGYG